MIARGVNDGFTFLEVLAGLLVFGILMAGLTPVLIGTMQTNSQARRMTSAAFIAQDKVEELRAVAYGALASGSDYVTGAGGESYTRSWDVIAGPAGSTQEVTVTISWSSPQSTHAVALETIVADL